MRCGCGNMKNWIIKIIHFIFVIRLVPIAFRSFIESKEEIDRFAEALINIKKEIDEIANGEADKENNVLRNAPHPEQVLLSDAWDKPYSREKAAYPLEWVRRSKFFATVSRIEEAYGDRNLVCTCEPIESYM